MLQTLQRGLGKRHDVTDSARGNGVFREIRGVTDSSRVKGVGGERRDVTDSARGLWGET